MKFVDALQEFIYALEAQYGLARGVVKIALTPEMFDRVALDLYSQKNIYNQVEKYTFILGDLGELKVLGVQLLARTRDDF